MATLFAGAASTTVPLVPSQAQKFADWSADLTSVDGELPPFPLSVLGVSPAGLLRLPERAQAHSWDVDF